MENDKITEGIKQMAEMFKNAKTERKAFVFMPDFEGFKVYEVSEESARMALTAQALKEKAEAERPNEDSGLGLQHVSFSEERAEVYCKGSIALGTACMKCPRCKIELAKQQT